MSQRTKSLRFAALIIGVVILSPPVVLLSFAAITGAPIIIALTIRSLLLETFQANGGAMLPALATGQRFFASKLAYGYSRYSFPFDSGPAEGAFRTAPERGDVAIFRFPPDPSIVYMMRVIGMPGDHVRMQGGVLYLNGVAVPRTMQATDVSAETGETSTSYTETLPSGRTYSIIDTVENARGDDTNDFTVPPNHYFVLGDNRDNSADSRFDIGFVPAENIYARANFIFFEDGKYIWPKRIN